MKAYLAARYSRHPQMRQIATDLRLICGMEITSRWIRGDHEVASGSSVPENFGLAAGFAADDVEDLVRADMVISFTEEPGLESSRGRGGRHVEFGMALALEKRLVVVGPRENVFHYLPEVEYYATVLDFLQEYARPKRAGYTMVPLASLGLD